MATLLENQLQAQYAPNREAELHNAQINERYRRLKEAENDQFAALSEENVTYGNGFGATIAPEYIQSESQFAPTEYTHTKIDSSLFNVETLERVIQNGAVKAAEELISTPTQAPVVVQAVQVQEESASLTRFAKLVAAAFMVVVALLLTVICINTQVINNKTVQLAELETTRQQLVAENVRLQQEISEAMSDEVIAEFARSIGMVQG